jgi:hypothetical protein
MIKKRLPSVHIICCCIALALLLAVTTACFESKEQQELRTAVMNALEASGMIPAEWREIGHTHPWGFESPDYDAFVYYYIDEDLYAAYEPYWNVDEADLPALAGIGDLRFEQMEPVCHAIVAVRISGDGEEPAYLATLYETGRYCVCVSEWERKDGKEAYTSTVRSDYEPDSERLSCIVRREGKEWICSKK